MVASPGLERRLFNAPDVSPRADRRLTFPQGVSGVPRMTVLCGMYTPRAPHIYVKRGDAYEPFALPRHLAVYFNVSGFELQEHRIRGLEKERPIRPMSSTHELEDRRLAGSSERIYWCFFARARNFITHTRVCPAWRTVCDRGGGSIMTVSATVRTCAMGPLLFGTMVLRRSTVQAWRPIWQDSDRAYLEPVGIFQ